MTSRASEKKSSNDEREIDSFISVSTKNARTVRCGRGRADILYNIPASFDIETSSFYVGDTKQCCMYAWVFGLNGNTITGRTLDEFKQLLDSIKKYMSISLKRRLIIYVHNLSFEFQFIRHLFNWSKVFAIDTRKPVYAITEDGFEFRCSYILTNLSLAKVAENLTTHSIKKLVGDLDYSLIRTSDTPITDKEWDYIRHDALIVMYHIQEQIDSLKGIQHIPLTNTGYVRNYTREICFCPKHKKYFRELVKNLTLEPDHYEQLKRAFAGGFTHANYHRANRTLSDVSSYDFTSSYPAVMLAEKFPMSKMYSAEIENEEQFYRALDIYCCVFDITFTNIYSKVSYDNYISYSRCNWVTNFAINNGRIIEADTLSITLTEQDFFIIKDMYDWDSMEISNFHYMYKAYLPQPIIEVILNLYNDKTKLKGVEGKEAEYLNSKGMLNSLYGMCVTDICRGNNEYIEHTWSTAMPDVEHEISKYNRSPNRFLFYAWGVWVTAYARRNLFTGIKEFGDDYIYSDTDSIKVLNADKHQEYFARYNAEITAKVNRTLEHYGINPELSHPKTIKGIEKPIGVWDYEGDYTMFKTLGAKRYIYVQDNKLHLTVAGVGKKAGAEYLTHTYGDFDTIFSTFVDGLEFPAHYTKDGQRLNGSGKLTHTYLDYEMAGKIEDYTGVEREYHELSGIHLENTSYCMSLEQQYLQLILEELYFEF